MKCPICSNEKFEKVNILKKRLIDEWELSSFEIEYINKQQGLYCTKCLSNLRAMTLAKSMMNYYSFKGIFRDFCYSSYGRGLKILEINEAGNLHSILKLFQKYYFAEYPFIDIQSLPYGNNSMDLVVHSDTLEHIENSDLALKECFRVLKPGGTLFYTIPIIYGRLTRRRNSLSNSYHGSQDESQGEDYKVRTEYGADFWTEIINAGFKEITLTTLENLTSISICAKKSEIFKDKLDCMHKVFKLYFKFLNKMNNFSKSK